MKLKQYRLGEVRRMNNGMAATLIQYNNCTDITVKFEDGAIVPHRNYYDFKAGEIANPNYRVGETKKMNCGYVATIIAYRHAKDMDVRFQDGTTLYHRQYSCFEKGGIRKPKLSTKT